ncbi:MerR family transcriptional regulator [Streptomyces achromogenes]|uniref:MerR family transcriptional regulator n=1 Tax=Streptomyces achromogenes TaxID=67255 RepID=UPI0036B5324C
MNDDGTRLFTIGELAGATGLSVRTIRFWSDEGVLAPATRSSGGYRLYDAASAARLELIRTLRELGLGLEEVRTVLAGERTVAEVAATHVAALDARIRRTTVHLAEDPTPEEADAWVEPAEMLQDPEFRTQMRRAVEFNAAGRRPGEPRGRSLWFAKRLVGVARYRELLAVVDRQPAPPHAEDFAWVVAALRARAGR